MFPSTVFYATKIEPQKRENFKIRPSSSCMIQYFMLAHVVLKVLNPNGRRVLTLSHPLEFIIVSGWRVQEKNTESES